MRKGLFRYKTTKQHERFWSERDIDWKQAYFDTFSHPHRDLIIETLRTQEFDSLLEIGCASGPNLHRISQEFPRVKLHGIDISQQAIESARRLLPPQVALATGSADSLAMEDKSVDVVLTDACLIYVGRLRIGCVLRSIRRVARRRIVFVELTSESLLQRLRAKILGGYNLFDYQRLLVHHGFTGVELRRIPPEIWGAPWSRWGNIVTACVE